MLRFLLTILLFSSGVKIVTANGEYLCKYNFEKYSCDEENKNEKAEKKTDQLFGEEEQIYYYPLHYSPLNKRYQLVLLVMHSKPYYGYFKQPNTPPPDLS